MPDFDELVGRNLQRIRGAMTQQALADLMRDGGYKWSQATVWATESGRRSLRLDETLALAKVFAIAPTEFTRDAPPPGPTPRERAADDAIRIGDRVRELRELAGMSQADLAAALTIAGALGIYPQTILKIEHSARSLSFREAVLLAEVLLGSRADVFQIWGAADA